MATSSSTCISPPFLISSNSHNLKTLHNEGQCSFLRRSNFYKFAARRPSKMDLVVRRATPEAAGDVISSFSLTGIPGFSLLGDNPWFAGVAGLLVAVPLIVQRLLTLTKEIDMASQTVEKIADAVEKVAEEVDKAAEDIAEALPEGGLKKVVTFVEELAEETAEGAQKVEDLMDKVQELDDKLEEFVDRKIKGTGKA